MRCIGLSGRGFARHSSWRACAMRSSYVDFSNRAMHASIATDSVTSLPHPEGKFGGPNFWRDPRNVPGQFKNYKKEPSAEETIAKLEVERALDDNDHELAYAGYTTPEIQRFKRSALSLGASNAELQEAKERLPYILEELCEMASGDGALVFRPDCHHVRFIYSIVCRRLGDLDAAERVLWDIVKDEPWNVDAIEGLLELAVADEASMRMKLKPTLDFLSEHDRVETAHAILADFIVTAVVDHFAQHGEGAAASFTMRVLSPIASHSGPQYMGRLLEILFESFDQIHLATVLVKHGAEKEFATQIVVAFLKTMVARDLHKFTSEPLALQFHILKKLHLALRALHRKTEGYGIAEKLIRLYRQNASEGGGFFGKDDVLQDYQVTLFQYVNDRAVDSPVVAKQLCIEAIEEFPDAPEPWRLLALTLQREGNLEDAIIAARKAMLTDSTDLATLLLLSHLYSATKRPTLADEVLERYKLLAIMEEQGASLEDRSAVVDEAMGLEGHIQEEDLVATQFAELREHYHRMYASTAYSVGASQGNGEYVDGDSKQKQKDE